MENTLPQIKTLDDTIKLIRQELNFDLTEYKFEFDLANFGTLRYRDETSSLHNYHNINGCAFYKEGKPYATLIVDIDPDWQMLNSADYYGHHPKNNSLYLMGMGINIIHPRTNANSNVSFGRTDNHSLPFLGISSEVEKVNPGLSALFVPRRYIP